MAMIINENRMNPIPLWDSKSKWQCNQKTFHDAMAWPVVPNGRMPKMALTVGSSSIPEGELQEITVSTNESNPPFFIADGVIYGGSATPSQKDGMVIEYDGAYPSGTLINDVKINLEYKGNGMYKATMQMYVSMTQKEYIIFPTGGSEGDLIPQHVLEEGGARLIVKYEGDFHEFRMSPIKIVYYYSSAVSVSIRRFTDDVQITTTSATYELEGCGENYNSDHAACMWIGGNNVVGTFSDGVYYIQFAIDGTTYYSEPFMWLTNLSRYINIVYRRSVPVVTTKNCIVFECNGTTRFLEAWLPGTLMMPPFKFNSEVTDIDGRKFAEKQVSYYNRRIAFNCYEAFLEAIRLLWHCDIRYMGNRRVDYMEPPEMDWNTDNHLCDVVLEMSNYDDVLQTNGTASSYFDSSDSSHQSYDASFDASFD